MKVQTVEQHHPSDEKVEREAQPPNKVGDEHHPLAGQGHGDDLVLLGGPVGDVGWELAGAFQVLDVIVCDRQELAFGA